MLRSVCALENECFCYVYEVALYAVIRLYELIEGELDYYFIVEATDARHVFEITQDRLNL